MSLTTLLIINTVITFLIFIKVDQAIKRLEEMDEFMKVVYKQFWKR